MVKEKFLIDSNIFITPYQNFYPFDIAPRFLEADGKQTYFR